MTYGTNNSASSNPQYFECASTTCLVYGANRNPSNPTNQAQDRQALNTAGAVGLVIGAPVATLYGAPVLVGMGVTAQTAALTGGVVGVAPAQWYATGAVGATFGAGLEWLVNPNASPLSLSIAGAAGAVGGAIKLGLNAYYGLANQWVPTTWANVGTWAASSQGAARFIRDGGNGIADSTSGESWLTSPVSTCGAYPRTPC
jgi:filamentous hemagglutinin